MVWLNYRNAYEYWHEQRMALASEIQEATQSVLEQTHLVRSTSFIPHPGNTSGSSSALFLQLTVNDIGICVPLSPSYEVRMRISVRIMCFTDLVLVGRSHWWPM